MCVSFPKVQAPEVQSSVSVDPVCLRLTYIRNVQRVLKILCTIYNCIFQRMKFVLRNHFN
jgi:hypothetical protein